MNKPLICLVVFITILLSCAPQNASANNAAGGDLIYEWVQDSTYRFYFRFYSDCAGSPEPATVTMCVRNTCNSVSFTRILALGLNPSFPTPTPFLYCPQFKNTCDSPASGIPGKRLAWYTDTCTLPSRCNEWVFSVIMPGRPNSNTIPNSGTTNMYVEATFNNTGNYQGNNSPYFTVPPVPFVCLNSPYMYNNGAVDIDLDSISTEVIYPRNSGTACPVSPVNATLGTATPPLSIPGNPINAANTFALNGANGQFWFTSPQQGGNTLAFRINEYRNGIKIGSTMRESYFHTLACAPLTNLTIVPGNCGTGAVYNPGPTGPSVETCTHPFSFCFSVKATTDTAAKLVVNINNSQVAPGSVVTYVDPFTDSVTCIFSWAPSANDTGLKVLAVTLTDTICKYPGIKTQQTFTIPIFIWSRTRALADTMNICAGTPAHLAVIGGGNFQWAVLSGTPGSLSCTNCPNPVVTPTVNSQYVVTSTINPFCPYITDTVTVNTAAVTNPSVQIAVSPGANVWPGLNVTFNATATACNNAVYQWRKNSTDIPGATGNSWSSTTLADMDVITCRLTCNDSCALPKDTLSNVIIMHVATGIKETNGAEQLHIYPNPNDGRFTIGGDALLHISKVEIEVWNSIGQVIYRNTINKQTTASNVEIAIPDIVPGIYQLSIRTPAGTRSTQFTVID